MSLALAAEPLPLKTDQDGVVRVGGTRVPLDTVVYAFKEGASAEEIALRYPTLELADVYAAITYYLNHRPAVESYLREREAHARAVRRENEARFDPRRIRERLLARQRQQSEGC